VSNPQDNKSNNGISGGAIAGIVVGVVVVVALVFLTLFHLGRQRREELSELPLETATVQEVEPQDRRPPDVEKEVKPMITTSVIFTRESKQYMQLVMRSTPWYQKAPSIQGTDHTH
jgi:cell division protein FtsN